MSWSSLFEADVVVLGCGNVLFGDDGLGPRCIQELQAQGGLPPRTALVDAGTSLRTLLTDMVLMQVRPKCVIVLDAVQEPGREPGSIRREDLDSKPGGQNSENSENRQNGQSGQRERDDPAGGFMHHAPTWGLLRDLRDTLGAEVIVLTVQAAYIPELMDDNMSAEALHALPRLVEAVKEVSCLHK